MKKTHLDDAPVRTRARAMDDMDRDATVDATVDVDLASSSAIERAKSAKQEVVARFESRRRARTLSVPTKDADVRRALRARDMPVTLFGEREGERRDRLRGALAEEDARDGGALAGDAEGAEAEDGELDLGPEVGKRRRETFYTEGSKALLECRMDLAERSLPRAAARTREARTREARTRGKEMDAVVAATSSFAAQCSEIGDLTRPISAVRFYEDGARAVSASWSGELRRWSADARAGRLTSDLVVRASDHRITGVDAITTNAGVALFASAHADGTAAIWNASDGSRARELAGRHASRCGRIAFHPDGGRYVATAGFDSTWRLWNVETGVELLCQEGHAKEVYDVAFHVDGGLCASAGLDAIGRVWDLRTGRAIANGLCGHTKQILSVDWSPNGHHLVTGSGDNTVKAWDLRRMNECVYTMANHENLVSQVKYDVGGKSNTIGAFLMSVSHDGCVCVYDGRDFSLNKKIEVTGRDKLACVDVWGSGALVGGFDRTVKLLTCERW